MIFNSSQFLIFFPVVTILFFVLPHRLRIPLLLAASCYFYMVFKPAYILILLFTITVDYTAGRLISMTQGTTRRFWLAASICANVGVLAFFKYFNFVNDSLRSLAGVLHWNDPVPALNIILPIGLSFHTFQSLSYTIEVYRGRQEAETNLPRLALYVLFYPQLVAGPIERPQNLLPQFHKHHDFDYERVRSGLQLMAWGLFKKIAVADQLAPIVSQVYSHPHTYSGLAILEATYCFAIQIYGDFSGYSDMAIGAAQVMGFRLMKNFDRPYFSQSIAEFWRRWHISLSTWFRDYLYIPLGGSRCAMPRHCLNLLVTFAVSGLWHGANWTFVVWGALNGVYLVSSMLSAGLRQRFRQFFPEATAPFGRAFRMAVTFHLILLSWFFFRASSIGAAAGMIRAVAAMRPGAPIDFPESRSLVLFTLAILFGVEALQSRVQLRPFLAAQRPHVRWAVYVSGLMLLGILSDMSETHPFIYFQF